jgi:hypothetical protein
VTLGGEEMIKREREKEEIKIWYAKLRPCERLCSKLKSYRVTFTFALHQVSMTERTER